MHRLAALGLLAVIACAKPPPPPPPAAELAVTGIATFAGVWVTSDDMDISYKLTVAADGTYVLKVDRNRLGTCLEKGTLAGTGKAYTLTYGEHQCHREWSNTTMPLAIASYTGKTLTVVVTTPEGEQRHTFTLVK